MAKKTITRPDEDPKVKRISSQLDKVEARREELAQKAQTARRLANVRQEEADEQIALIQIGEGSEQARKKAVKDAMMATQRFEAAEEEAAALKRSAKILDQRLIEARKEAQARYEKAVMVEIGQLASRTASVAVELSDRMVELRDFEMHHRAHMNDPRMAHAVHERGLLQGPMKNGHLLGHSIITAWIGSLWKRGILDDPAGLDKRDGYGSFVNKFSPNGREAA